MAYSDNFPTQRAVFTLDASNAGRLDPRCSFSRASTGSYFGTDKHLSSENLIPNSNANAAWQTINVTKSVSGSFLDGSDSLLVSETVASGQHYTGPNIGAGNSTSFVSGTEYTATLFAKAGSVNSIQLVFTSGVFGSNAWANYDLSNAAITPIAAADAAATITALGSGWVKLTLTATATASTTAAGIFVVFNNDDINSARTPVYTGSTASNVYLWEANLSSVGQRFLVETNGVIHRAYAPTLQTAASGAARFEHSATDGQSVAKGILLEGQSTNLATYSETLATGWTETRCTLRSNVGVAPDGTLSSNLLEVDGSAGLSHNIRFDFTTGGATPQTVSVYAKAGSLSYIIMRLSPTNSAFDDGWVSFNLSNGTVGTTNGSMTSSSIESCGNGWYRCSITKTALINATGRVVIYAAQADDTLAFDGNSYDHIQIWGAQIEANQSFSSSYIKSNSGSTTTRAADSLSLATSSFYTGGPVSVTADYDMVDPTANVAAQNILLLSDGSSSNRVLLYNRSGKSGGYVASADGSTTASGNPSSTAAGAHKLCVVADTNNYIMSFDGTSSTDTAAVLPSGLNQIDIGSGSFSGHISRVSLFGTAISETAANALTS